MNTRKSAAACLCRCPAHVSVDSVWRAAVFLALMSVLPFGSHVSAEPSRPAVKDTRASALNVRVVDTDGKPCGAIEVCLWRLIEAKPANALLAQDRNAWIEGDTGRVWNCQSITRSKKKCTFDALLPGTYRVSAHAVHGKDDWNTTPFGLSEPIVIVPGAHTHNVTLRLMPGLETELHFVDADTKAGVPNVAFELTRADGFPIGYASRGFESRAGEEGVFRFGALPAGKYTITGSSRPHQPEEPEYSLRADATAFEVREEGGQIAIPMIARAMTEAEIDQRWPYVAFGTITDESGAPLPGVDVSADCGMGTLRPTGNTRGATDGSYTLRFSSGFGIVEKGDGKWGTASEVAHIFAFKEGYCEQNLCRHGRLRVFYRPPAPDNPWIDDPDKVIVPKQPYRIDFVMMRASAVSGTLLNDADRVLAGTEVSVSDAELHAASSVLRQETTDEKGRFTVSNLPRKEFWFEVDGARSESVHFVAPGEYTVELRLAKKRRKPVLTRKVVTVPDNVALEEVVDGSQTTDSEPRR